MKNIMKNKFKFINVLFWGIYFLCFLPIVNKGIDVTDTSYCLIKYKYMFTENAVGVGIGTILTNIIGGVLYNLVSNYQLLLLNVVGILAFCTCGVLTWKVLKDYKQDNILLVGILAANFLAVSFIKTLNYNSISALFFYIGVYLLINGLFKENKLCVFFSGIVLALNVFTRIPNILHFSVGIAFVISGIQEKNWKKTFREIVIWCLGAGVGVIIGAILSLTFLDVSSIFKSLNGYSDRVASSSDVRGISYGIKSMVGFIKNGFRSAVVYLILPIIGVSVGLKFLKNKKIVYTLGGIASVLCGLVFILRNPQRNVCLCCIYVIAGVTLAAGMFFFFKREKKLSILCGISLALMAVCPFGSDTYIQVFSFYAYLPICVTCLVLKNILECTKSYQIKVVYNMTIMFLISVAFIGGSRLLVSHVYRDASYTELTEKLDKSYGPYAGMKTSEKHKKAFESTKGVLAEFAGEELLYLGDFNVGCLVSDTIPFFSTPWPDLISFEIEKFETQLIEKTNQGIYPVIMIANEEKFSLRDMSEKEKIVEDFINKEEYKLYYQDEYITVYTKNFYNT